MCKDMEILNLLIEYNYPFNENTCKEIAYIGNIDTLKKIRKLGCPWNGEVLLKAASNYNSELLYWAIDQGCDTTLFNAEYSSCPGCGKGGYGDINCRCDKITYDSDDYLYDNSREEIEWERLRRQD